MTQPWALYAAGVTDRLQTIAQHGPDGQQRLQTFLRVRDALEGDNINLARPGVASGGLGDRLKTFIGRLRPATRKHPDRDQEVPFHSLLPTMLLIVQSDPCSSVIQFTPDLSEGQWDQQLQSQDCSDQA